MLRLVDEIMSSCEDNIARGVGNVNVEAVAMFLAFKSILNIRVRHLKS